MSSYYQFIRIKLILHLPLNQIFISHPAIRTKSSPQPDWFIESYLIKIFWALQFFLVQSSSPSGQPGKPHPPPSSLINLHIHPSGIFLLSRQPRNTHTIFFLNAPLTCSTWWTSLFFPFHPIQFFPLSPFPCQNLLMVWISKSIARKNSLLVVQERWLV